MFINNPGYDVIIIGAGASGLICAVECARRGKKTLVLEKSSQTGRKILASGNGRCNVTNAFVSPDCYRGDTALAQAALAQFSFEECTRYFNRLGVLLTQEGEGRVFPATGKATAVAEALKLAALEAGAEIKTDCEARRITHKDFFTVSAQNGDRFSAKRVVLACGSCAYPQLTGTRAGYELAQSLGHRLIEPVPALCALNIKEKAFARLAGIRCQVRLTLPARGGLPGAETQGELLFTNYGLSGPAAINISGPAAAHLAKGEAALRINFFPQTPELEMFFQARMKQFGERKPKDFFAGMLHENIANLLIDFTGLRKTAPMLDQTPHTLTRAQQTLGGWPVTAVSARPWTEAMAAAGGVNTREINYNTFESLIRPGLYITGELLNVDGKSGGFNLHFAWSSGLAAARNMPED